MKNNLTDKQKKELKKSLKVKNKVFKDKQIIRKDG